MAEKQQQRYQIAAAAKAAAKAAVIAEVFKISAVVLSGA